MKIPGWIATRLCDVDLPTSWPCSIYRVFGEHPVVCQLAVRYFGVGRHIYQIAGHNQSPLGSFATTSTLPYLMVFLPAVVIRADWMGGIVAPVDELLLTEHAV